MSVPEQIKNLAEKALDMHREYSEMSANFRNLERQFDKLTEANERLVDRLAKSNEELRGRVIALEGLVSTILTASAKEAALQLQREYLEKHGKLPPTAALPGLPDIPEPSS